jgi:hypothetical protein
VLAREATGSALQRSASIATEHGSDTWFQRLFGFRETAATVRENFELSRDGLLYSRANDATFAIGRFGEHAFRVRSSSLTCASRAELPSLAALRRRTKRLRVPRQALELEIVWGDVATLMNERANRLATFQAASQFNCLEFVGPNVTPEEGVSIYQFDRTQGPACAIACGPATVYRNYFVPLGEQVGQSEDQQIENARELLAKLGEGLVEVRGGYTLATDDALRHINKILNSKSDAELDELRGLLRVGVHSNVQARAAACWQVCWEVAKWRFVAGDKQQLGDGALQRERSDCHPGVRGRAARTLKRLHRQRRLLGCRCLAPPVPAPTAATRARCGSR